MKPRLRFAGAAVAVGALVLWFAAPRLLRRLEFFRVRQIELVGIRFLPPDAVIAALRLGPDASVFDDTKRLGERVKELHGVADARVVRRLPGALRLIVREAEPAALVPGPRGLTVVDGEARALPFDPARSALDVPVAATADRGVVGVLALIQSLNPALFRDVSAARRSPRGDVLLELGSRRVLLGRDAGPEVIRAVVLVAQDLAAKGHPYAELDARFAGQVVVRRRGSPGGGGGGGA